VSNNFRLSEADDPTQDETVATGEISGLENQKNRLKRGFFDIDPH